MKAKRQNKRPKPRSVTLVRSTYQPSKAELGEPIVLRKADGTKPTPQEAARAILWPVKIKHTARPE